MTRPARKPTITDKLVAWKQAYDAVLGEITHGLRPRTEVFDTATAQVIAESRAAAAHTAALLIQGTDYGNDRA